MDYSSQQRRRCRSGAWGTFDKPRAKATPPWFRSVPNPPGGGALAYLQGPRYLKPEESELSTAGVDELPQWHDAGLDSRHLRQVLERYLVADERGSRQKLCYA